MFQEKTGLFWKGLCKTLIYNKIFDPAQMLAISRYKNVGNLPTWSYICTSQLCQKRGYMLIIYLKRLNDFGKTHANARKSLAAWKLVVEEAEWKSKQDVLQDFPKAKMIQNNRARFEIVHNTFRLIAHIHYDDKIVEIRFIGTHNEYDKIDPATI